MKKLFFTLLTLCLCGIAWAFDFSVTTEDSDGTSTTIYYNFIIGEDEQRVDTIVNGENYPTVEVTWGGNRQPSSTGTSNEYAGDITIPATVSYQAEDEEEPTTCYVVGVGSYAFSRSSELTSLVIPSTINYLETCCVYNCSSLKNVVIDYAETPLEIRCEDTNNLPTFGYSQIETLELDRNLTIRDDEHSTPFYQNTYIQNVIIGENVKEFTAHAFEGCTKLKEVTVSNMESCALTTIGDYAFNKCSALEHITIPASVTTFGQECLANCTSLRNVFLLATEPSEETLSETDFQNDTEVTLYVPRSTAAAYYASQWQTKVVARDNVSFNFFSIDVSEDTADEEENCYWATYYIDQDKYEVDVPNNCTLYTITDVSDGTISMQALQGDTIPAGTPLLVKTSASGANYFWRDYYDEDGTPFYSTTTPTTITVPEGSILYGHSEAGETFGANEETEYYFYKLSLDGSGTPGSIGFYWGASDGGKYTAGANRCWLAVPSDEVTGLSYLSFKKDNGDTTGISSVESVSEAKVSGIYTIQGVRVSNMNQPGLYIVDGKKVLVK